MQPTVFQPMNMAAAEALLMEAKQILDQLELIFFLRHGTCLGAVRDHGFIPWDDDLDLGSVLGLHGLTEESVYQAADVFEDHDFSVNVSASELHISVEMTKNDTHMDWTCYRIIGESIFQYPVVEIPVRLYADPKEIEFLGTRFFVPNPPEEYLRLKYGPEWMVPKQTGFELDILNLIPEGSLPDSSEKLMRFIKRFFPKRYTGSLRIMDEIGNPVRGAEVVIATTTVLAGLDRSITDSDGYTRFSLPEHAYYVLAIRYGDHEEVLYMEQLAPGIDYVYRANPDITSGRANVLSED